MPDEGADGKRAFGGCARKFSGQATAILRGFHRAISSRRRFFGRLRRQPRVRALHRPSSSRPFEAGGDPHATFPVYIVVQALPSASAPRHERPDGRLPPTESRGLATRNIYTPHFTARSGARAGNFRLGIPLLGACQVFWRSVDLAGPARFTDRWGGCQILTCMPSVKDILYARNAGARLTTAPALAITARMIHSRPLGAPILRYRPNAASMYGLAIHIPA